MIKEKHKYFARATIKIKIDEMRISTSSILILIIATLGYYIYLCIINIAPTSPILVPPSQQKTKKYFSSSSLLSCSSTTTTTSSCLPKSTNPFYNPLPSAVPDQTVFQRAKNENDNSFRSFNYGRYHHKNASEFARTNFDFPSEVFENMRSRSFTTNKKQSESSSSSSSSKQEENKQDTGSTSSNTRTSFFSSFTSANANGVGWLQKLLTLKEWSWVGITDGEEWFCGTALSDVQSASGFFLYCYNSKTGRAFHGSQESVEWHLLGGFGTQKKNIVNHRHHKNNNRDRRESRSSRNNRQEEIKQHEQQLQQEQQQQQQQQPYANHGCLEWDNGRMSNENIASGSHCYDQETNTYRVHAKMIGVEILRKSQDQRVQEAENNDHQQRRTKSSSSASSKNKNHNRNKKNIDATLVDDLEEGPPVEMEVSFSFEMAHENNHGMTLVYPLGDDGDYGVEENSIKENNNHHEDFTTTTTTTTTTTPTRRAGMTTKFAAARAHVEKLVIKKMTSFEKLELEQRNKKESGVTDGTTIVSFNSDSTAGDDNDDDDDTSPYETKNKQGNKKKKNKNDDKREGEKFVALLDWTRSMFPRHTVWKWVAFATTVKSATPILSSSSSDENSMTQKTKHHTFVINDKDGNNTNVNPTKTTRIGMQITGLSYLLPENYSAESTIWIDGTAHQVNAKVEIEEVQTTIFTPKKSTMWNNLGRTFRVSFDETENNINKNSSSSEGATFLFKLDMRFVRRGAHVQDFSEFAPIMDGQLDHQWGEYSGELTQFYRKSGKLFHIYRFGNVPGILEDHDTWW